jgi:hypothetical protein
MMRIWIDTEFNEFRGALMSMTVIDEAGREFYRSFGWRNPGAWVSQHVMPIIGIEPVTMADLQRDHTAPPSNGGAS